MTTSKEYCDYILECLDQPVALTVRPMMGEYLLYYRGTLIGGIYDEQLLLKEVPGTAKYHLEQVIPYASAKRTMYLVENLDDKAKLQEIILATYNELSKEKRHA